MPLGVPLGGFTRMRKGWFIPGGIAQPSGGCGRRGSGHRARHPVPSVGCSIFTYPTLRMSAAAAAMRAPAAETRSPATETLTPSSAFCEETTSWADSASFAAVQIAMPSPAGAWASGTRLVSGTLRAGEARQSVMPPDSEMRSP